MVCKECKRIHIGHGDMDEEYKMRDAILGITITEINLVNLT